MTSVVTVQCPHCRGSGRLPDWRITGAKVRAARKTKRLSLRELARMVGCSYVYLSNMERGKLPWRGPASHRAMVILGMVTP